MVAAVATITALLLVPFLTMAPDTSASTEPDGDVFTARDRNDETFVSSVHPTFSVVEADDGDLLTADALGALLGAEDALRADPELAPTLFLEAKASARPRTMQLVMMRPTKTESCLLMS